MTTEENLSRFPHEATEFHACCTRLLPDCRPDSKARASRPALHPSGVFCAMAVPESPSPTNPLGVKGVGETGTIAAAPAVINAVLDALSHLGVKDIQMPATPERVWRAIQEAKA